MKRLNTFGWWRFSQKSRLNAEFFFFSSPTRHRLLLWLFCCCFYKDFTSNISYANNRFQLNDVCTKSKRKLFLKKIVLQFDRQQYTNRIMRRPAWTLFNFWGVTFLEPFSTWILTFSNLSQLIYTSPSNVSCVFWFIRWWKRRRHNRKTALNRTYSTSDWEDRERER